MVTERFIQLFSTSLQAGHFPFDSQNFTVVMRSSKYDRASVVFTPVDQGQVEYLPTSDGSWNFKSLQQSTLPSDSSLYPNWQLLQITVSGSRVTTNSVIVLLFPGVVICLAQVLSYVFPLKSDSRMGVAITGIFATITYNFVLVQGMFVFGFFFFFLCF